jgi:hypothetical protein
MNPNARETPEQYAYRKCNEAIIQVKAQRTELQGLLKQAYADNATIWIARVKQALKENRIKLNQLCARRASLRNKLNAVQNVLVPKQNPPSNPRKSSSPTASFGTCHPQ